MPSTSDPFLGSEKWAFGPTGLILKQSGGWTYGMLVNHVVSFAGDEERADVNQISSALPCLTQQKLRTPST